MPLLQKLIGPTITLDDVDVVAALNPSLAPQTYASHRSGAATGLQPKRSRWPALAISDLGKAALMAAVSATRSVLDLPKSPISKASPLSRTTSWPGLAAMASKGAEAGGRCRPCDARCELGSIKPPSPKLPRSKSARFEAQTATCRRKPNDLSALWSVCEQ